MTTYRWVNSELLNTTNTSITVDGITLDVQLSPFDTPRGISGEFDTKSRVFSINFQYADEEPPAGQRTIDDIAFVEGKHSGKLLKILIPTSNKNLMVIELETRVVNALKKRRKSFHGLSDINRQLNQDVASEVLHSTFNEIAGELVGA